MPITANAHDRNYTCDTCGCTTVGSYDVKLGRHRQTACRAIRAAAPRSEPTVVEPVVARAYRTGRCSCGRPARLDIGNFYCDDCT